MSTRAHVLVVVLAAAVIVFIFQLVRRRQLRAKYSVLWLSIGLVLAVFAVFPGLLEPLSDAVGIDYPPATFMLMAISFLLVLVLHFSWEISRLEDRTRTLAEELALLREMVVARDHDQTVGGERPTDPGERPLEPEHEAGPRP
jgi:hypothetical protein